MASFAVHSCLLAGKSANFDIEKSMLSKLKMVGTRMAGSVVCEPLLLCRSRFVVTILSTLSMVGDRAGRWTRSMHAPSCVAS